MDPNALYAALNTVAQCAAALAALIGFLGLWRLDRLRDEREQAFQLISKQPPTGQGVPLGIPQKIARLGKVKRRRRGCPPRPAHPRPRSSTGPKIR
jgi:hypothetical protein